MAMDRVLRVRMRDVRWILAVACVVMMGQSVALAQALVVTIMRPQPEQTIVDNSGAVPVAVALYGTDLSPDKRLRVLLDGKPYGNDQSALEFTLQDVVRGEHSLQMQLVDGKDVVLAQSPAVRFHMFQASALFPTRKPAVPPLK
jgi:hypothetical protein